MSRITGSEIVNLMEAYTSVYYPQELTEEHVWEEVETWANSLVEEGYDLSDYTWEEMYEEYLNEMGQAKTTGQSTAVTWKPTPGAGSAGGSGSGGRRGSGSSPGGVRPTSTTPTPPTKPAPTTPYKSRFAGARDAAVARAQNIKGSPVVGPRPAAGAAAASARPAAAPTRPATTAPATSKPAATPSGGSALDRATAVASKPAAFSPKPQSDVGAMIARSQARQSAQTPKPSTPTSAAKPTPRQARLNMEMEYDTFDAILEHLIAEGYADTNENAIAIMANMSEEWKESIIEQSNPYGRGTSPKPMEVSPTHKEVRDRARTKFKDEQSATASMVKEV